MSGWMLQLIVVAVMPVSAVTAAPMPGQVIVDPHNPRWLARYAPKAGLRPLFICGPGDPEDFLYRGRRLGDGTRDGDQAKLIAKLTGAGANCIYIQAVRSHGGDGDHTHNPFVDNDPAKGLNEKVLAQWRTWLDALDRAGIVTVLFIYDDSARIWNTGDAVGPAEREFLTALVGRFKHMRNLIWCVAEEYQERYTARRVSNIAAVIRQADGFAHPIAVHKLSGLDFSEFADDPNIDQFAIQYNADSAARLHAGMLKAWSAAKGRYNLNMSEAANHGTGAAARKKSWACAMAGAYVMVLKMDIASTPPGDLRDCGRLVRFFESTDFRSMSPHDELAGGDTEYVLADPPRSYILYASNRTGPMGLKGRVSGTFRLQWLDCATGKTVTQAGVKVDATNPAFVAPAGIGREAAVWVAKTP